MTLPFTVTVGNPTQLKIVTLHATYPIYGGEFFSITPKVHLLDRGGNLVVKDSTSALAISLFHNPTKANLGLEDSLFPVAKEGIVQFRNLVVDKVGVNYTFLFQLYNYSNLSNDFTNTGVSAVSDPFTVLIGPPRKLRISARATQAWAGKQPFHFQPIIHITDYGNNIVNDNVTRQVSTSIVPSLSASKQIVIDTSDWGMIGISDMKINLSNGTYGVGQHFVITLFTPYFVFLETSEYNFSPNLRLNIIQFDGQYANAKLIIGSYPSKQLRFEYIILEGDSKNESALLGIDALNLNGTRIVDGNNNPIDITLPTDLFNVTIHLDTAQPSVAVIASNATSSEYGVGDVIRYMVKFDQEIIVFGYPYLRVNVDSNVSQGVGVANFSNVDEEDERIIYFDYIVQEEHNTPISEYLTLLNPHIFLLNITSNNTLIDFPANLSSGLSNEYYYRVQSASEASIRRKSTFPTFHANYTIAYGLFENFNSAQTAVVDTSRPIINAMYGIRTSNEDGTYYVGDEIDISIQFDKDIEVVGVGLALQLDVKANILPGTLSSATGLAFYWYTENDNRTIHFLYRVEEGTNTSTLSMISSGVALQLYGDSTLVLRKTSFPITAVNFSTEGIRLTGVALYSIATSATAAISLYGYPAEVTSVQIDHFVAISSPVTILYPDDYVYINVTFSTSVITTCQPVLNLQLNYVREAQYIDGNNTNTLVFRYQFQVGDYSNQSIAFLNRPTGLCAETGCPLYSQCAILVSSANPTQPVSYWLSRTAALAIQLGNQSVSPFPANKRNTTISRIYALQPPGEYGAGSELIFVVEFTDVVILRRNITFSITSFPTLRLNVNNRTAQYRRGSHSNRWFFAYLSSTNDTMIDDFLAVESSGVTNSPIYCFFELGCQIVNAIEKEVDLRISSAPFGAINSTYITLNPARPNITNMFLEYNSAENYTAGEMLRIVVVPSKPVAVLGLLPRILLAVGQSEKYAVYNRSVSSSRRLCFDYVLSEGDTAKNITYLGTGIDSVYGFAQILRLSTVPVTPMDVSFPNILNFRSAQRDLIMDATTIPTVIRIESLSDDSKLYLAGDRILLQVIFSEYVYAYGTAQLLLNGGMMYTVASMVGYKTDIDNLMTYIELPEDTYRTNKTRCLIFEYVVNPYNVNSQLDYVDTSSLILPMSPVNLYSYIRRSHATGAIDVDLSLPVPGTKGSISFDTTIRVDGRPPRVISLLFMNNPGVYSVNASVTIKMEFNLPVLVFPNEETMEYPSVLLETGRIDNQAYYVNGSGSSILFFVYHPAPGDMNDFLDYFADRINFGDTSATFRLNGGSVLAMADFPILKALVRLNPTKGNLEGIPFINSDEGVFQFLDNYITYPGMNYELFFSAEIDQFSILLETSQLINNTFSAEQQLRPKEALTREMVGHSVALEGDMAVIGAPNFNVSTTTIQVVRISVADHEPQQQVQLVSTSMSGRPAIQTFYTTTNIDETVGGTFSIFYGTKGPSSPIPANANAATLTSILLSDIPSLGNVTVSVRSYDYCACYNAFVWTLTFHDFSLGTFGGIQTDGSGLTSTGVFISPPTTLQSPSILSGTFKLKAYGLTSSPIPYDASVADMANALAEMGLSASDISISPSTNEGTRSWSITFNAHDDSYDIELLQADSSGLTGGSNMNVFTLITQPGFHGPYGISGFFQLTWRENTTYPLRPNTTATQMKDALESLETINYVNVNRTLIDSTLDVYSWTIEFVSYNYMTVRGLYEDTIRNVEPIESVNHLIATDASIKVDAKWEIGTSNKIYSNARQGSFGEGSGGAFVYQRVNQSWEEVAYLIGNDTAPGNRFGTSVAIHDDVIAVGAVGANMNGQPEIQGIRCLATEGEFQLSFRGWTTDMISFNATVDDLYNAIVAQNDVFGKLYSITNIVIDDWGGGGLCANNTARITFYSPINGAPELFDGIDNGGDLELLTVSYMNLTYSDGFTSMNDSLASIDIFELQKGTWNVNNYNADPQQIGAVYIYRRDDSHCDGNSRTLCLHTNWKQEAQIFPSVLSRHFSEFGDSLQFTDDYLLVGAPGSFETYGAVYLFYHDTASGSWRQHQIVRNPLGFPNERFGTSFSMYESTLAIGTPGYDTGEGCVYIFFQASAGANLILAQIIFVPASLLPVSLVAAQGDMKVHFGFSVSIEQDTMVIGAPNFCDSSIYTGTTSVDRKCYSDSGSVFVYRRPGVGSNYIFKQRLTASNIKEFDQLGYKVHLEDDLLLVSAYSTFLGNYSASQSIIQIESVANYSTNSTRLGGSFKLRWKAANSTYNLQQSNASLIRDYSLITRPIPYDATALQMQRILEEDLHTEQLIVSRDRKNLYTDGYIWVVTFLQFRGSVELFQPDIRQLTGSNPSITVKHLNVPSTRHRSKVHLFERISSSKDFVEELFLSPSKYQAADLCGHDIALSGSYALIGCPNRDQSVHPNRQSGAGFLYDLSLLQVQFTTSSSIVLEGSNISIAMSRDPFRGPRSPYIGVYSDVYYNIQSLDRNANYSTQFFIEDLYDIHNGSLSETFPPQTILDFSSLVGKAHARTQFYGNVTMEASVWVDGRYDYRAVGDYVPLFTSRNLLAEWTEDATAGILITTADRIDETPRENVTVIVQSPGLWPSPLGHYYHHVTIEDVDNILVDENGDIVYAKQASYTKLVDDLGENRAESAPNYYFINEKELFGKAIAVDIEYGVLFVSATHAEVDGNVDAGKVMRFDLTVNTSGTVVSSRPLQIFVSPVFSDNSLNDSLPGEVSLTNAKEYGNALAVHTYFLPYSISEPGSSVYGGNMSVLAIGQAAINRVFLYATMSPSHFADRSYSYLLTLTLPEATLTSHLFGYTISILEDMLIVAAPGLESVYLYYRHFNLTASTFSTDVYNQPSVYASWLSFGPEPDEVLRSSDYIYDILFGDQVTLHRQGFGTAVAAAARHIVITAPFARYDFQGRDNLVQDYDTEGVDILSIGRGKAYVFYSPPPVIRLCLVSVQPLQAGTFFVSYTSGNLIRTTGPLSHDISARNMQMALMRDMDHIGEVSVRSFSGFLAQNQSIFTSDIDLWETEDIMFLRQYYDYSDNQGTYAQKNTKWFNQKTNVDGSSSDASSSTTNERSLRCWDVSLLSAYQEIGSFSVQMLNETVCFNRSTATSFADADANLQMNMNVTECLTTFDQTASLGDNPVIARQYFTIRTLRGLSQWQEFQSLTATNANSGDMFGASVAIDDEYIVVGAPQSNGLTTTDWTFETGTLQGWAQAGGTAFRYQPTFGDNVRYHSDPELFHHQQPQDSWNNNIQRQKMQNVQGVPQQMRVDERFQSDPPRAAALVSSSGTQLFQTAPSSNLRGRYYLSTYEQRPGAAEDYTWPDPAFAAGSIQGAAPVGSLTSDTFIIQGNMISFLIGGGCDIYQVYVELLVDGMSVQRVTGNCDTRMKRVHFSTQSYLTRAAQIRIVDNSTTEPWGFVSADDFVFDWDTHGAARNTGRIRTPAEPVLRQEPLQQPQVGAAYLFRRIFTGLWDAMPLNQHVAALAMVDIKRLDQFRAQLFNNSQYNDLSGNRLAETMTRQYQGILRSNDSWRYDSLYATTCNDSVYFLDAKRDFNLSDVCRWQPITRMLASDSRDSTMHFGYSVAVNAAAGLVVVSAPNAMRFNAWKDALTNHPYLNATSMASNAAGLRFPLSPSTSLFKNTGAPGFFELGNNVASDLWLIMQNGAGSANYRQSQSVNSEGNELVDLRFYSHAGAVYFYQRQDGVRVEAQTGELVLMESWSSSETAKYQASDTLVRDDFGTSLALVSRGNYLFIGSSGQDLGGLYKDAGAVYAINTNFLPLRFTKVYSHINIYIYLYCYFIINSSLTVLSLGVALNVAGTIHHDGKRLASLCDGDSHARFAR